MKWYYMMSAIALGGCVSTNHYTITNIPKELPSVTPYEEMIEVPLPELKIINGKLEIILEGETLFIK